MTPTTEQQADDSLQQAHDKLKPVAETPDRIQELLVKVEELQKSIEALNKAQIETLKAVAGVADAFVIDLPPSVYKLIDTANPKGA